jgi:hypothetical protein
VGTTVVKDQVQLDGLRVRAIDLLQEVEKLLRAVLFGDPSEHVTGRDVECGVEACRSVPLVVVGPALDLARPERQHRLRAIQSLDLRLLIHRKDNRVVRRFEMEAHHVDHLLAEARVVADLERFDAMRPQIGCLPYLLDLLACHARQASAARR